MLRCDSFKIKISREEGGIMFDYEVLSTHLDKYVENINSEMAGCSEAYKLRRSIFPAFNHLNVYFPEAYQHMLKVWGIDEEN